MGGGDSSFSRRRASGRTPDLVLEGLLGEAAEHAQLAVFVYDDNGRYVSANRYGAELLGLERAELLAHDIGDFTEGGFDRAVLSRPEQREGVRVIHRRDGTSVTAAFVVVPTVVGRLPFYLAVVWELPPGDDRAVDAV